jgi:hypothetical protein
MEQTFMAGESNQIVVQCKKKLKKRSEQSHKQRLIQLLLAEQMQEFMQQAK